MGSCLSIESKVPRASSSSSGDIKWGKKAPDKADQTTPRISGASTNVATLSLSIGVPTASQHASSISTFAAHSSTSEACGVLLQAGSTLMKLAEVRSEQTAPIDVLRGALETILLDSHGIYGCVQMITEGEDFAIMLVSGGESPSERFLESNRAQWLGADSTGGHYPHAATSLCERVKAARRVSGTLQPNASTDINRQGDSLLDPKLMMLGWSKEKERAVSPNPAPNRQSQARPGQVTKVPSDWQQLAALLPPPLMHQPRLCAHGRDNLPVWFSPWAVHEVRDMYQLARHVIHYTRLILGFSSTNSSIWFRLAFVTGSGAAVIIDDPDQFNASGPPPHTPLSLKEGPGSPHGFEDGRPPLARAVVDLKSSILKQSITNRQQVMIPDIPAFLSKTQRAPSDLYVNTDKNILGFQCPSSALVFPLKASGHTTGGAMALGLGLGGTEESCINDGCYGSIFCMSGTLTDFSEVSSKLREVCNVLSPHILQVLTAPGPLCDDYQKSVVQVNPGKDFRSSSMVDMTSLSQGFNQSRRRKMSLLSPSTGPNIGRKRKMSLQVLGCMEAALRKSLVDANDSLSRATDTPTTPEPLLKTVGSSPDTQPPSGLMPPTLTSTGPALDIPFEGGHSGELAEVDEEEEGEDGEDGEEGQEEEGEEGFEFVSAQDIVFESLFPPSHRAAFMIERMVLNKRLKPQDLLSLASDLRGLTARKSSNPSTGGGHPHMAGLIRGALSLGHVSVAGGFDRMSIVSQFGRGSKSRFHGSKSAESSLVDALVGQPNAPPTDVTKALINLLTVNDKDEEEEEDWEEGWDGEGRSLSTPSSPFKTSIHRVHKSTPHKLPEHAAKLLKAPSDLVAQVLAKIDEWQFDSFELNRVTDGRPLSAMAFAVLKRCDLIPGRGPLKVHEERLVRFLCKIEDGYPTYVVRSLYVILTKGGVLKALWPPKPPSSSLAGDGREGTLAALREDRKIKTSEIHDLPLLSAIISAAIHDYEHKGFNNDFLVRSGHPLTMLYNDYSPMEQHHLSAAFGVLWSTQDSSANISSMDFISGFSHKNRTSFRKQVIDMVLATDMKQHFNQLSQYLAKLPPMLKETIIPSIATPSSHAKTANFFNRQSMIEKIDEERKSHRLAPSPRSFNVTANRRSSLIASTICSTEDGGTGLMVLSGLDDEARTLALQMALKCADIGHWASDQIVHRQWVQRLEEEFFRQGDCEHEAGLPISPLMDRSKGGVTTSQGGFFSFVVQPQMQAMVQVFPGCMPIFNVAKDNLAMWEEEIASSSSRPGSRRASTPCTNPAATLLGSRPASTPCAGE